MQIFVAIMVYSRLYDDGGEYEFVVEPFGQHLSDDVGDFVSSRFCCHGLFSWFVLLWSALLLTAPS